MMGACLVLGPQDRAPEPPEALTRLFFVLATLGSWGPPRAS